MRSVVLVTSFAILFTMPALAQTSYPMVMRIEPTAVQRGTTAELTISGSGDFSGPSALLVQGESVSGSTLATITPAPAAKGTGAKVTRGQPSGSSKVKFTADANALAVPREVRLVTPVGVSSVGLVVVTNDPVVTETDEKKNNTPSGAQKLKLPVAISGRISVAEDVDWFEFEAQAGQTVTISVWGNRLENKIHDLQTHLDPIAILLDDQNREIAADDNHDFADPLLIYTFKKAGTYRLQIRDTNYAGNANWTYVAQLTSSPFATAVFPTAINPGKPAQFTGTGANFDAKKPLSLDAPASTPTGISHFALKTDRGPTQAFPLVVTDLPIVKEVGDTPAEIDRAQLVSLPAAICGQLLERNDVDCYKFEAKKGQIYAFEVVARRARSAADPTLRIIDAKGNQIQEIDDSPGLGKDLRVEWTAPSDGVFGLRVFDLHNRGGAEFGYALLAQPAKPDFVAVCDPDKINIGPGSRTPMFVKVTRRAGFTGAVTASFANLPPGVSASPLTIPPGMTQGEIVVSATSDAKPLGTFVTLHARGEGIDSNIAPNQEIYLPGGGRGLYPVSTCALAVTKPSDILVDARPSEIILKPGETATIDVTVMRQNGYAGGVNLAVNLSHLGQVYASPLPTGVTLKDAGSKTLLGPKDTVGKIVLQAAPDAPACDKVPIAVMGHVSINFVVKTAYSSGPILITIPAKDPKAAETKPAKPKKP